MEYREVRIGSNRVVIAQSINAPDTARRYNQVQAGQLSVYYRQRKKDKGHYARRGTAQALNWDYYLWDKL